MPMYCFELNSSMVRGELRFQYRVLDAFFAHSSFYLSYSVVERQSQKAAVAAALARALTEKESNRPTLAGRSKPQKSRSIVTDPIAA